MTDIVKESLSSYKQELGKLEDRVNSLETKLIQNDLVMYGLKNKTHETDDYEPDIQNQTTMSLKTRDGNGA